MSMNFRAVREEWGESSSLFVDHEDLITIICHTADAAGTMSSAEEYGEVTSVWIDNGRKFLEYVHTTLTPEEAHSYVPNAELESVKCLVGNMKQLASRWLLQCDKHGCLHFYID
jgi:dihydroxyacetone kinase-like predicted kinase